MRLRCDVTVQRLASARSKPTVGSVTIGHSKDPSQPLLLVSTKKDLRGSTFQCNGAELEMFVRVLKSCDACKLGSLQPPKAKHFETKKRIVITDRHSYPFSEGFPSTLQSLEVIDCQLGRIDPRWSRLKALTVLNLSGNGLGHLDNLDSLCLAAFPRLAYLNLGSNELTRLPNRFWLDVSPDLASLSLEKNYLTHIPESIGRLTNLAFLKLSLNQLTELPVAIGAAGKLRDFQCYGNIISVFPASMLRLKLNFIDLTNQSDSMADEARDTDSNGACSEDIASERVPTLREIAAKFIKDSGLTLTPLPIGLQTYIAECLSKCGQCGLSCMPSVAKEAHTRFDLRKIACTAVRDPLEGYLVTLRASCCSTKCKQRFLLLN